MGRIFLAHPGGTRLFSCGNCDTALTNRSELTSTVRRSYIYFLLNINVRSVLRTYILAGNDISVKGIMLRKTRAYCYNRVEWKPYKLK